MGINIRVADGLIGLCVGDALGVPVEFKRREELKENPVKSIQGFGKWNQPPGTWSDDSSLTFCLADSLCKGLDIEDIALKFIAWYNHELWTPHGRAFDIGITTMLAIKRIINGVNPTSAGGRDERSNGNGSLMRILPLAYYLMGHSKEDRLSIITEISSITHGHKRSTIACFIYIEFAISLLKGNNPIESYQQMKEVVKSQFKNEKELNHFKRILDDISQVHEDEIKSSGYVVDTLEASLWCLLTTSSYVDAVLKAVNLGEDTDTTGAVTGGLAGIYYGIDSIPGDWINSLARKDDIYMLAERFELSLKNIN